MASWIAILATAFCLAACAGEPVIPGPDHSLATSSCTNGDPDLREAKLGCPD